MVDVVSNYRKRS